MRSMVEMFQMCILVEYYNIFGPYLFTMNEKNPYDPIISDPVFWTYKTETIGKKRSDRINVVPNCSLIVHFFLHQKKKSKSSNRNSNKYFFNGFNSIRCKPFQAMDNFLNLDSRYTVVHVCAQKLRWQLLSDWMVLFGGYTAPKTMWLTICIHPMHHIHNQFRTNAFHPRTRTEITIIFTTFRTNTTEIVLDETVHEGLSCTHAKCISFDSLNIFPSIKSICVPFPILYHRYRHRQHGSSATIFSAHIRGHIKYHFIDFKRNGTFPNLKQIVCGQPICVYWWWGWLKETDTRWACLPGLLLEISNNTFQVSV